MRFPILLPLLLALASCATPEQRALQQEQYIDTMITVYGTACEKLGFHRDTDVWRNCVLQLDAKDNFDRYSRSPTMINCFGRRGFSQCTTF